MPVDIDAVARILVEVAAAEVLPRFRALERDDVREKDGGELVTVADVAAEAELSRRLLDLLPGSYVVGEEAVAERPDRLERLHEQELVWVIDPIDGTSNFARGHPVFAVMAALVRSGRTVAAWIHDPVGARTAAAEAGGGARLDGRPLATVPPATPEALRGTLHAGTFATAAMARHVQARRAALGAIRSLACAGHEYLRLSAGETHYSLFTKLMPWDHAPGCLILAEAGGVARTLDGAPYAAASYRAAGLLLGADEATWRTVRERLFAGAPWLAE